MDTLKDLYLNHGIFGHPTEGVWGLGCNPFSQRAVKNLFSAKNRPKNKSFIILAGHQNQIDTFLAELSEFDLKKTFEKWPGPHTWLIPAAKKVPSWLIGDTGLVALRLSNHSKVIEVTKELGGPICSTSANLSGEPPAKTKLEMKKIFGPDLFIVDGELGKLNKPTPVQELITGKWIRK